MKDACDRLMSRLGMAKEKTSKLKHISTKAVNTEKQSEQTENY